MKKNIKRVIGILAFGIIAVFMISSLFNYNTRPLPFEDQEPVANPIESTIKDNAEKLDDWFKDLPNRDYPEIEAPKTEKAPKVETEPKQAPDVKNENDSDWFNKKLSEAQEFFNNNDEATEPDTSEYDRDKQFGSWKDLDGDGCDTRDEMLARDLVNKTKSDRCTITSGVLHDKYTGEDVHYIRGKSKVDLDHMIPLSYAYKNGANEWSQNKRVEFANDPVNLVSSSASANRSKGDKGPADWMPSNSSYQCEYAEHFREVSVKYEIKLPASDAQAIARACA